MIFSLTQNECSVIILAQIIEEFVLDDQIPPGRSLDNGLYTKIGALKMMARKRSKGLTERQKRILDVLEDFQENFGYPPSIREICENALISSTSVVN